MRGLIVLGGDAPPPDLLKKRVREADLTIAADGGLMPLRRANLVPDIAVGDFDSVKGDALSWAEKKGCRIEYLSPVKDQTDGQEAVDRAIEEGCGQLVLLGGFGGRFDHQLAHLSLLARCLRREVSAHLEDGEKRVAIMGTGEHLLRGMAGDTVSILPFGEGLHILKVEGLAYPIDDKPLPVDLPFGISNVMTGDAARIRVASGLAVVVHIAKGAQVV